MAALDFRECEQLLPTDMRVTAMRIDTPGYSVGMINNLMSKDMHFAVRAKMDSSVREMIGGIGDDDWLEDWSKESGGLAAGVAGFSLANSQGVSVTGSRY